jgi:hypothetical protein
MTALNWLAGITLGLLIAASCNLDGPDDIQTARDTAAAVQEQQQ